MYLKTCYILSILALASNSPWLIALTLSKRQIEHTYTSFATCYIFLLGALQWSGKLSDQGNKLSKAP
jgi:hypothetical protein